METKLESRQMERVCKRCGFVHGLEVESEGFFHSQATQRKKRNLVQKLVTEDEEETESLYEMEEVARSYFQNLFSTGHRECWHFLGNEVTEFCLQLLNGNMEVYSINLTNIVLIPKIPDPSNLTHFRPISLCNVLYKIMAKAIANRFQVVIEKCIDDAQSAFVPGRLISDNVLLAYEVLHMLKQKRTGKKGFMVVKLDMSKAYNRVE
ncbi:hypothetical protein J1N35_028481 [Gossypium stocksii]|uniref:Reverse transcriptase domain-containing protein n=1 Tax=Gossypium stocksii TaxID=47602 RepID=A0A9D3UWS5_9ROSI|nr:hypothetical protein J1N35_028481 [Gossypium stocksii]